MQGKTLSGGPAIQSIQSDRQAREIPVLLETRSHDDIKGDGPWVFLASRSGRLKIAIGRMRPKFTPLGAPLLGNIVWAQFKNYRFVTKDRAVAVEMRLAPNYSVSFELVSDSAPAEETPLKAGNERKEREVSAAAIQAPIRTQDELDGDDVKDRTPPSHEVMVKKPSQDTIRRG